MVTLALAGASTGFGLTLLRVFLEHNATSPTSHNLIILTRHSTPVPALSAPNLEVRPIDYNNHGSLVTALDGVHTLLSTIGGNASALRDGQLALVAAAKEAGVKRFAPSEYAGSGPGTGGIELYKPKKVVWEALRESEMEYTRFCCGLFMSVLATGTPKGVMETGLAEGAGSGEEEALAGLRPWNWVFDLRAGTVELPGDGEAVVGLTDMRDVARFVLGALELEKWPEELGMVGDRVSLRQVVGIVEEVQGRNLLVREDSVEGMRREMELNPEKAFYNQTRLAVVNGYMDVPGTLNELCPWVKPITVREFVEKWWGGVDLPEPSWEAETQSFNFT